MVEVPTVFNFNNCTLTLYETQEEAENIVFKFNEPIVAIMLSGKKILKIGNQQPFDFVTGNIFISSPNIPIIVDLPDASSTHPTICLTLSINRKDILKQIELLIKNNTQPAPNDIKNLIEDKNYYLLEADAIYQLIQRLVNLTVEKNPNSEQILDIAISELIIRLSQTNSSRLLLESVKAKNIAGNLSKVIDYINANYQSSITIEELCSIACVSKSVLFRSFKMTFNLTPLEYVLKKKIDLAKHLLDSFPHYTIKHVSIEAGFNSESYFNFVFKKLTGTTPLKYRNRVLYS